MLIHHDGNRVIKIIKRLEGSVEHIREDLMEELYNYDMRYIEEAKTKIELSNIDNVFFNDYRCSDIKTKDKNFDYYNGYYLNEYGEDATYDYINGFCTDNYEVLVVDSYFDDKSFKYTKEYVEYGEENGQLVYITYDEKNYYLNLDSKYELYKCDGCQNYFLTYRNQLEKFIESKSDYVKFVFDDQDLCLNCYEKMINKRRVENGKKVMNILYNNGKIPSSRPQRYICNLLEGELNHRIGNFFVDMLLNNNIIIEYDGSGHWLESRYGDKTIEQIDKEDIERDKELINKGYKVIRFVSKEDLLPSDRKIRELIDKAINNMNRNKSNKYIIEINKKEYLDTELRKIKSEEVLESV